MKITLSKAREAMKQAFTDQSGSVFPLEAIQHNLLNSDDVYTLINEKLVRHLAGNFYYYGFPDEAALYMAADKYIPRGLFIISGDSAAYLQGLIPHPPKGKLEMISNKLDHIPGSLGELFTIKKVSEAEFTQDVDQIELCGSIIPCLSKRRLLSPHKANQEET